MEFTLLYKIFTLSVQGKYTLYKTAICERFQLILKNLLLYFPESRMANIIYTYWLITHSSYAFYLTRTWLFEYLAH